MGKLKWFIGFFVCFFVLTSCASREETKVTSSQSITIQTFSTVSEPIQEPQTTPETLNTDRLTAPTEESTVPSRTVPKEQSVPIETSVSETERTPTSDTEASDYEITPTSSEMYASSSVNVREEPDADSKRVGHLDKGEKVTVTGYVSNGWMRILFKDGEFYVNGSYLTGSSKEEPKQTEPTESVSEPITSTNPPPETVSVSSETEPEPEDIYEISDANGRMTVTDTLNVRDKPDVSGNKVGSLKVGDTVTVTGFVSNGWVRIIFENQERFVSGEYLRPANEEPQGGAVIPASGTLAGQSGYNALNYPVQKAVWFAYLDIDSMLKNADRQSFTASVASAFDSVVSIGCNTVYVHVRSFGDAYYNSLYYPFTAAYSDTLGVSPDYDPLEIMIEEAHNRGLSFHAWINPMRTTTKARYKEMSSDYTLKQWYESDSTNGTFLVYDSDTGYYWLSPAYSAVRQLICRGVAEIVSNYKVDAIHIDDYFYPTTSSSFDKAAFEASGASDRAVWRRSVVSSLVREIYNTVKSCNSSVLFGVSPQGNIENNRDRLYADVDTWCTVSGYLDYIVPQIYYGFNDKLSFDAAAKQWQELVTLPDVKLICGIAAYKVGVNSEWSSGGILKKQTEYISGLGGYDGIAYYRQGSLFGSASSSEKKMKEELASLKSAIADFK